MLTRYPQNSAELSGDNDALIDRKTIPTTRELAREGVPERRRARWICHVKLTRMFGSERVFHSTSNISRGLTVLFSTPVVTRAAIDRS